MSLASFARVSAATGETTDRNPVGSIVWRSGVKGLKHRPDTSPAALLLGGILFSFAVFAIWPAIDLRVSKVFHHPETGFAIDGNPFTEALRMAIWNVAIMIAAAAVVGIGFETVRRTIVLPTRVWGFILVLYALGPGLMVEMLAKPLWGRARPAMVSDFGGTFPFSAANELADICSSNCSFVSGEVAGATVTAVAFIVLRFHRRRQLRHSGSMFLLIAACCLPPVVALQRIAAGRHFLSDTVFAVLFTLLLALALSKLFRPFSRG